MNKSLSERIVWKIEFIVEDLVSCLPLETKEKFSKIDHDLQEKIILHFLESIASKFENGFMGNWINDMASAIGFSGLNEALINPQYYYTIKLSVEELKKHASISIKANHECNDCFSCACIARLKFLKEGI